MFDDQRILITGGTGSFGKSFVRRILKFHQPKEIIIYSRDEMKQWEMANSDLHESSITYRLGDVRDIDRLTQVARGVDLIIHAAASNIVPLAEFNPTECIQSNVVGAMNVVSVALSLKIPKVVALSTDKASNPINLYGASKLLSDKLFLAGGLDSPNQNTRFSVVRYGNVIGSRGSVVPLFDKLKKGGRIPITDPSMTRFMITMEQAMDLVEIAVKHGVGHDIFVRKIPSMNILDIAEAIAPGVPTEIIGIRVGEKLHEQMISVEDAQFTFEFDDHYRIFSRLDNSFEKIADSWVKVPENFEYRSNTNQEWWNSDQLRAYWKQSRQNETVNS
jgi:UDP-N-acetylglucosamine 4,6-dehydratase